MSEKIFGLHAITAVLQCAPERVLKLYMLNSRHDNKIKIIEDLAKQYSISLQIVDKRSLDNMVKGENHQGIVADCKMAKPLGEKDLDRILQQTENPFFLILDGVQDPHNLGACLRTADATGVTAVIIPKDKASGVTNVVRKVSCGASEVVPIIQVTNLARALNQLKDANIWLYGLADKAETSLYDVDLKGGIGFVLGAEGAGIRQLTEKTCDFLVNIPMEGFVSSLNVSVATGVCLYEAVRARRTPNTN